MVQAARTLPRPIKGVITHTASFLCGLLLSSVRLGEAAPFGVSFLAAVPVRYLFSAGAGAAAGSRLTLDSVSALRSIAALLSAGGLVRLSRAFGRLRVLRLMLALFAVPCWFGGGGGGPVGGGWGASGVVRAGRGVGVCRLFFAGGGGWGGDRIVPCGVRLRFGRSGGIVRRGVELFGGHGGGRSFVHTRGA